MNDSRNGVLPSQLFETWCEAAQGRALASFDCFDTVLWRGVSRPTDVFCELVTRSPFLERRMSAQHRIAAEAQARRRRFEHGLVPEVTLAEIYEELFPSARWSDQASQCVELECAIESSICFVSPHTAACMHEARRRGMPVAVVSDTYMSETQLRRLLALVDADLASMIDFIFCSSDYRIAKSHGLWDRVIKRLGVAPNAILHVGDNAVADVKIPEKLGVECIHLRRYPDEETVLADRRDAATRLMFTGVGETRAVWTLFDSLSFREPCGKHGWYESLGRSLLGPVLYAFAKTLCEKEILPEFSRSYASNQTYHHRICFGFLMRDAHLLREAADIVAPSVLHPTLHVSRQSAFSASFDSDEAIVHFMMLTSREFRMSLPQCAACLLLNEEEQAALICAFETSLSIRQAIKTFFTPALREAIKARSAAYRGRLIRHIVKQTGVRPGDTLCLVDIGYHGTIQWLLRDILFKELDVKVIGRYLIYRDNIRLMGEASGLIDASWVDQGLIRALTQPSISYLENLCAGEGASVVDYGDGGEAFFKASSAPLPRWMAECQRAALLFVDQASVARPTQLPKLSPSRLRECALTNLGAMLFFPSEKELSEAANMQCEVNLGGSAAYEMCDHAKGLAGLRRRGLLYFSGGGEFRSNRAFELRYAGMDQLALYMICLRNGLRITEPAFSFRRQVLPITFRFAKTTVHRDAIAHATYDGYFTAVFPLGNCRVDVKIGTVAKWLQLESITSFPAEAFGHLCEVNGPQRRVEPDDYQCIGVTRHEEGLMACERDALIRFSPIPDGSSDFIRLVFRTIAGRDLATVPLPGGTTGSDTISLQLSAHSNDRGFDADNSVYPTAIGSREARMIDEKFAAVKTVMTGLYYTNS